MGLIKFNGRSCQDYGIWVEHPPKYSYPKKDVNVIHVPGRNGDIVIDDGTYQNVTAEYELATAALKEGETYSEVSNKLADWLHTASGYAKLEDTYYPDIFRMAYYMEEGTIDNIVNIAGRITVKFECKPQKYLKIGSKPIRINAYLASYSGSLFNPTNQIAKPIIIITNGSGNSNVNLILDINGTTMTVKINNQPNQVITIDTELMDAYSGVTNVNDKITLNSGSFPVLSPGENSISISGGGTLNSIEIIPNWWTI